MRGVVSQAFRRTLVGSARMAWSVPAMRLFKAAENPSLNMEDNASLSSRTWSRHRPLTTRNPSQQRMMMSSSSHRKGKDLLESPSALEKSIITNLEAAKEIAKTSSGLVPLQMIKGVLPFSNSMLLARLGSSARSSATLINTLVDVNYLLFSSPTFCISAAVGALNTPKDRKHIGEVVHAGWILSGICTVPQMSIMYFNVPLLMAAGQDPELVKLTNDFLQIYLFAVPVVNVQNVSEQAVFATNHIYLPCSVQVLSLAFWALAAYGLSFGAMGLPQLGIQGAAYAYLGRVYFNSVVFHSSLIYLNRTNKTFASYNLFTLQPGALRRLKSLSRNAMSIFGLFLLETGEIYFPNIFAGLIGGDALSAQLLVSQYQELILFVVSGLAISSQVLVANALGSKKFAHIKRIGNMGIKLSLCLPLVYTGTILISPDLLIQAFIDPSDQANQAIIDLLIEAHVLLISGFNISMISFRMAAAESLIGAGKAGASMVKNMAVSWLGIGLGYGLGFVAGYGLAGVNAGLMAGLLLSSVGQGRLWYKTSQALHNQAGVCKSSDSKLLFSQTETGSSRLSTNAKYELSITKKPGL